MSRRALLREVYISKKLSEYFSNLPIDKLVFLPNGANNVGVSNVRRIGGSNEVYSLLLKYRDNDQKKSSNLVLKTYVSALDPVLRTYADNENLERCVKEFQVLRHLEHVDFPAPRAYLCECDSNVIGYPFIVMLREELTQNSTVNINSFAKNLARLHNLDVATLGIGALKTPNGEYEFARRSLLYLKLLLNLSPIHDKELKKNFEFAIRWLELNIPCNGCPKYCLLHGDYRAHLNTIFAEDSRMIVRDWEDAEIGDPAYDVGIAYTRARADFGKETADRFVQEYFRYFDGDLTERLFFYKLVGSLRLAIFHSSVLSNPIRAYEIRGLKAFLSFPFLRIPFFAKRTGTNLDVVWVESFKEFFGENLKR